jgi:hypothetical protein
MKLLNQNPRTGLAAALWLVIATVAPIWVTLLAGIFLSPFFLHAYNSKEV